VGKQKYGGGGGGGGGGGVLEHKYDAVGSMDGGSVVEPTYGGEEGEGVEWRIVATKHPFVDEKSDATSVLCQMHRVA